MEIQIVPLAPNVELPRRASPRTRATVPAGYGVQEQCLPFTAASALGFVIPSPISFGHCPLNETPAGCRAFRSPIPVTGPQAEWVFYVKDQPASRFIGNAYSMHVVPVESVILEPGLSFFDREDQQDLFKLHLPYIWRTPPGLDILFLPLLNRMSHGLEVQSGLVETDWYTNPVNLILRKPPQPAHIESGAPVAQAIPIARETRETLIQPVAEHSRLMRETRKGLAEWRRQHTQDRGAYKKLARDEHGRVDS
jgi:hypothetical protein